MNLYVIDFDLNFSGDQLAQLWRKESFISFDVNADKFKNTLFHMKVDTQSYISRTTERKISETRVGEVQTSWTGYSKSQKSTSRYNFVVKVYGGLQALW
jgi:hypothetical protein